MFTVDPNTSMLFFCASLTLTYLAARLNLTRVSSIFVYGVLGNSLMFYCYAIARGLSLGSALAVGMLLGLIFTPLSIGLALFFRETAESVQHEVESLGVIAHEKTSR